jgi:hypothetical protein
VGVGVIEGAAVFDKSSFPVESLSTRLPIYGVK